MKTLLGGVLIAIGILIAGASGLCTITFVVSMIVSVAHNISQAGALIGAFELATVVGGLPFAIGIALFFTERLLIRSDRDD